MSVSKKYMKLSLLFCLASLVFSFISLSLELFSQWLAIECLEVGISLHIISGIKEVHRREHLCQLHYFSLSQSYVSFSHL